MAGWGINAAAAAEVDLAVATRGPTPCAYPEREGNRVRKRLTPGRGRGRGGADRGDATAARARSGWPPELLLPLGGAGSAWRASALTNPELASISPLLQPEASTAPPLPPGMTPGARLKAAASRLRPLPYPTPKRGPGPAATPLLRLCSFSAFRLLFFPTSNPSSATVWFSASTQRFPQLLPRPTPPSPTLALA